MPERLTGDLQIPDRWIPSLAALSPRVRTAVEQAVAFHLDQPGTQVELSPLAGAGINRVYRLRVEEKSFCFKVYTQDQKARVFREVGGLSLLHEHGVHIAPLLHYAQFTDNPQYAVMAFLEGSHLGNASLSYTQLECLWRVTQQLHAITPSTIELPLWKIDWDIHARLEALRKDHATLESRHVTGDIAEARTLAGHWLRSGDPQVLSERGPVVFSRGDQNLANCLWDGTELRVIDLEYCGWNDRAFDLASLVEHIQSRGTSGDLWELFIDRFDLSSMERRRFKAAQRRLALSWLLS